MVVVSMELIVLGDIPLGIRVVVLSEPSDGVAYGLHNCYPLDRLYVEIIFRNLSSVSMGGRALIGLHGWPIK